MKKTIIELTRTTLEEYRRAEKHPVVLVCDNIRSGHNVGSLLRTCDAFMVEEVVLCGITPTPPTAEISKTALGAEESVSWRYAEDSLAAVRELRARGYEILVLEQAHGSIDLCDFRRREGKRYALVAGNEVLGVRDEIVDEADVILEIKQGGIKHSLNVSVSAGIALFQVIENKE